MGDSTHAKFLFNFQLRQKESANFSLLSETESDRNNFDINSQINELKSQLEIVNEDRERLKKENEKLRLERDKEIKKALNSQKQIENDKILALQGEVVRLKKECEEKDFLLNKMRKLLGGSQLKENREQSVNKCQITGHITQSRIPTKNSTKLNRSISPYSTIRV